MKTTLFFFALILVVLTPCLSQAPFQTTHKESTGLNAHFIPIQMHRKPLDTDSLARCRRYRVARNIGITLTATGLINFAIVRMASFDYEPNPGNTFSINIMKELLTLGALGWVGTGVLTTFFGSVAANRYCKCSAKVKLQLIPQANGVALVMTF